MAKPSTTLPDISDPLGETLHLLRLTGTLYCRGEFTAPFAIQVPRLEEVMTFVVVTAGGCWLEVEGADPRRLESGDLALLPHGIPHVLSSDPSLAPAPLFDLPVERVSDRYETMHYGGGGELTSTMYGVVRFDAIAARHLLRLLPRTLYVDDWPDDEGDAAQPARWLRSTLQFIASEAAALRPGGETVITRLADVVVIQAIRAWLAHAPEASQGWLGALRDPQIGRALALIHRQPAGDWTVTTLARAVAMSRSAFSARFSALIGQPPGRYLTEWRMQLAGARLRDTTQTIAAIADELGYQSDAAFCRAFKRSFAASPGQVRRRARHDASSSAH